MTTMADNPTIQNHSNFFWEDPAQFRKQVPRLAVLLVNSTHCLWKIKKKIDSTTRNHPNELFWNCWSNAHVTICADGGANRLYDRAIKVDAEDLVIPQYIKGDLDSIRDDVKEFYRKKGTQILHDVDQNTNDLDKCLQLLADLQRNIGSSVNNDCHDKFTVMIFGAMGGRFDQEIQNINALFRWSNIFQDIILLSEETTAVLLLPGKHMIYPNFQYETRTCGLVPITGTCLSTKTKGLKWNLTGQEEMKFGGLISTSNQVLSTPIIVENSHPLIWTTELRK